MEILFYESVKAAAKEGTKDTERGAKDLTYHYTVIDVAAKAITAWTSSTVMVG